MFPMKNYLKDFYKMSDEEILVYAKKIEIEVYNNVKKDFLRKSKEISGWAVELFKKKFWFINGNQQRVWNRMEDDEIDNLFKKNRNEFSDMFDTFKCFKLCSPFKRII
jgi:hypothetical protein